MSKRIGLPAKTKNKACALAMGFTLTAMTASASADIAQVPLFLTPAVEPNIMFTIDDSGSMHWEVTPDDLTQPYYSFPRIDNVYGPLGYNNSVPTFTAGDLFAARYRSAINNTTYYDPAIRYRPWVRADGTEFPNAPPSAAPHNPTRTNLGTRNLTQNNTGHASWRGVNGTSNQNRTFFPAVYYRYNSGNRNQYGSYTRVEIRTGDAPFVGGPARTDCANPNACSYNEEIQNFANWYTYHRSRVLAARGGIGRAFIEQDESIRVGFGSINQGNNNIDGVNTQTISRGVRPFEGDNKQAFYDLLYNSDIPAAATPLRRSARDVGEYFSRTDNSGPWGNAPGTNDTSDHLACRLSYHILMTDGYWNGPNQGFGNVDSTQGPAITGPGGQEYRYEPRGPFSSDYSDTLADIAMHYWNRDLRPDLANRVPTTSRNPAFWQHLVTLGVGLGVTGSVDPEEAFAAVESGEAINWQNPFNSNPAKIDDLLHAAINSRGGFFSAGDPETFATELEQLIENIVAEAVRSAGGVSSNSTFLEEGSKIFQARLNSLDWSGDLFAYALADDGSLENPDVPTWSAAQQMPAPEQRAIVTWQAGNNQAVPFTWDGLNGAQRTQLNNDQNLLDYLRGDDSNEEDNGGAFRNRSSALGDIVNSTPTILTSRDFQFSRIPGPEGREYRDWRRTDAYRDRQEVVFVGANDGMLHAFNADTGREMFAFIPSSVFGNLPELADPDYVHRYFVDGSMTIIDAYINGSWRTVLVGSTGAGGRSVFALDVTDPDNFSADDVLWEFTHPDLGYTIGQPTVARLPDGSWAAVFGNGYRSDNHGSSIFLVNLADGSLKQHITLGGGSAAEPNGMGPVIPVDLDGTRITNRLYAGDEQGNIWRVKLGIDGNQSDLTVESGRLFQATDPDGNAQPITARPEVSGHPDPDTVMVTFGTGSFFQNDDRLGPQADQVQTFYAIIDDGESTDLGRGTLLQQFITDQGTQIFGGISYRYRNISSNTYDATNPQDGWYLDLVYEEPEGERVLSTPIVQGGRVRFTTFTPSEDPCQSGGVNWLMIASVLDGQQLEDAALDLSGDGEMDFIGGGISLGDGPPIDNPSAIGTGRGIGTLIPDADDPSIGIDLSSPRDQLGRQSWRQIPRD